MTNKYSTTIRDYLPQYLNIRNPDEDTKLFLPSLYEAIDVTNQSIMDSAEEASKQLFIATASGRYLINLGASEGFVVPVDAGVDIDAFRDIVPAVVSTPKQVTDTIVNLIGIFYDKTRIRPFITAELPEPYSFTDGDTILITTDAATVSVGIFDSLLDDINNVSAAELAGLINAAQSAVTADVFVSRETGENYIRLIAGSYGVSAFIHVTGGTAQNIVKFESTVDADLQAGTTWEILKDANYTDVTKLRWNGVGITPKVFNVEAGDFVTMRDFTDDYVSFNGTFKVLEVGYDTIGSVDYGYFVISNIQYQNTIGTLIQPNANSIVFTSQNKKRLFDNFEYGLVSENTAGEVSVFVPAVPLIVRRRLKSGAFLHGFETPVLDFTRSSITVDTTLVEAVPNSVNSFILQNEYLLPSFEILPYRTNSRLSSPGTATYSTVSTNENQSVLPFTVPTQFAGTASGIFADVLSKELIFRFSVPHGYIKGWGITVSGGLADGNITAGMINKEHSVTRVIDSYTLAVALDNGKTKFDGVTVGGFQLIWVEDDSGGYDFILEFTDPADIVNGKIVPGLTFTINYQLSTFPPEYDILMRELQNIKLTVTEIQGTAVFCYSGIGKNFQEVVVSSDCYLDRSAVLSDASTVYYLDKTSTFNQRKVMSDLKAIWLEFTESTNPNYVGSYIYDTTGTYTTSIVGSVITNLSDEILTGSNLSNILVDGVDNFPTDGYLYLNYGTDLAEGPIRYFSIISSSSPGLSQFIINPAYVFQNTHPPGSQVQIVRSRGIYDVRDLGEDYPAYITGTAATRDFFFDLVRSIVAVGVFLREDIAFPELRYSDPAIEPYL